MDLVLNPDISQSQIGSVTGIQLSFISADLVVPVLCRFLSGLHRRFRSLCTKIASMTPWSPFPPIPMNKFRLVCKTCALLMFPSFFSCHCILTSPYVRLRNLLSPLLPDHCVRFDMWLTLLAMHGTYLCLELWDHETASFQTLLTSTS